MNAKVHPCRQVNSRWRCRCCASSGMGRRRHGRVFRDMHGGSIGERAAVPDQELVLWLLSRPASPRKGSPRR